MRHLPVFTAADRASTASPRPAVHVHPDSSPRNWGAAGEGVTPACMGRGPCGCRRRLTCEIGSDGDGLTVIVGYLFINGVMEWGVLAVMIPVMERTPEVAIRQSAVWQTREVKGPSAGSGGRCRPLSPLRLPPARPAGATSAPRQEVPPSFRERTACVAMGFVEGGGVDYRPHAERSVEPPPLCVEQEGRGTSALVVFRRPPHVCLGTVTCPAGDLRITIEKLQWEDG